MKQSIQLRLGQQLAMTPQLQQAIRLLQLSTLELQAEVQEALESNLMLERDDDGANDTPELALNDHANGAESVNTGAESSGLASEQDHEVNPVDIPQELAVDTAWDDIYDAALPPSSGASAEMGPGMDIHGDTGTSMAEHLLEQVNLLPLSDTDFLIAACIADSTDHDGYLRPPISELCEALVDQGLEVEEDEIHAVLTLMQSLEPAGVCARDLGECLAIQLRQLSPAVPWRNEALQLVEKHIDLLAARDHAQLSRALNVDREHIRPILTLIQTLNPKPGQLIETTPPEYVTPDVFVSKRHGRWQVELNVEAMPKLRVNPIYASMVRRADSSQDNTTMKNHLQEARWFIKSLRSRSETLLRVASCIVERQQGFLEFGEEAMKPMVLHDIAEVLELHESTVSRVTTNKYMHTPRGVFELKFFFSSHVFTKNGAECSSTAIRALLKKLISAENPQKPLSDSKLSSLLSDQGIKVARRTVAKYREAMSIPSSTERKALA